MSTSKNALVMSKALPQKFPPQPSEPPDPAHWPPGFPQNVLKVTTEERIVGNLSISTTPPNPLGKSFLMLLHPTVRLSNRAEQQR